MVRWELYREEFYHIMCMVRSLLFLSIYCAVFTVYFLFLVVFLFCFFYSFYLYTVPTLVHVL